MRAQKRDESVLDKLRLDFCFREENIWVGLEG